MSKKNSNKTTNEETPAAPTNTSAGEAPKADATPKPEDKKKATDYVVAIGSLMVGRGETRKVGATVKATELSAEQLEYFVADGTLKAK